jgi:predicted glycosyltransferase
MGPQVEQDGPALNAPLIGPGHRTLAAVSRRQDIKRLDHARVLIYSHDTFGLGHLRRCRAIAHAIVERFKGVSVLIISGSQIAGAYDYRARVDFVKIPSVIKLYNGEYDSIGEYIDVRDILRMRRLIIQRTAESFEPDLMIVDKAPLGLKGELEPTLALLSRRGAKLVLGLRDVMDSAQHLEAEWRPKAVLEKMERFYDRIWVYGPRRFWNPLKDLKIGQGLAARMHYVGFIQCELPAPHGREVHQLPERYLLVTAGGGGDGSPMMEQVLAAREHDSDNDFPLVLVLGPFMRSENRERVRQRAANLANVHVIDFETKLELLLSRAVGVVGMCGYNTFCETLSFDRKALFVPRTHPRLEQHIRATRASALDLCDMIEGDAAADPPRMAAALRRLPDRASPSAHLRLGDLDGLEAICDDVAALVGEHRARRGNGSTGARVAMQAGAGK